MADKDQVLVKRTLAGDRDAFGDLIERYADLIHGVILEKIRRPDDVEDLMQETFAKAYQSLSTLDQPAKFAPWIGRIAANLAVNWLEYQRAQIRAEKASQPLSLSQYDQRPDVHFEENEVSAVVWEALDHLPPEHRRVVVLYHIEGCSQRDIARFLEISLPTVRWRLRRAWGRLRKEMEGVLGNEMGYRFREKRRLREKIMALLPPALFFRLPQPSGLFHLWSRRVLPLLGGMGVLGLSGLFLFYQLEALQENDTAAHLTGGFRVRHEQVDLPQVSALWQPARPQSGQPVRLQLAGPNLPEEGPVFLHYISDLHAPQDRVVEMEKDGDSWVATVRTPPTATNLFFYGSADDEPQCFAEDCAEWRTWRDRLRRYTGVLAVHDARGWPLRGAEVGLGQWASNQKRPKEEILQYFDRELARHPDHVEANQYRWSTLQWSEDAGDPVAAHALVQEEKAALQRRFPDNADLAWLFIENWDTTGRRAFARRFPEHKNAAAAAYGATFAPLINGSDDYASWTADLEQFLQDFPHSPYVDDAYRDLLYVYNIYDRARGKTLADSLINRQLVPVFDPAVDEAHDQPSWTMPYEGALPEARAYTLRFKWYLEEGDTLGALDLARRLLHSDLPDPIPYVIIGEQLVEADSTQVLGLKLLEAGRPWTDIDHILRLPLFLTQFGIMPVPARQGMKQHRREDALEWRIRCMQALGKGYLERGECAKAAPFLRETVSLQGDYIHTRPPFDEQAYLLLGQASACSNDWDGAVAAYLQVVQRYYHHAEAEAALERLYRERYGDVARLQTQLTAAWSAAPDFHAVDLKGDSLHLAEQRGRPLLLFCDWRQSGKWQWPDLEQLADWHQRFTPRGAEILFITRPTTYGAFRDKPPYRHEDVIADLKREHGYPFRMLLVDKDTNKKYGTTRKGLVLFLVDRAGRLRLRQDRSSHLFDREAYDRTLLEKLEDLLAESTVETDQDAWVSRADVRKTGERE